MKICYIDSSDSTFPYRKRLDQLAQHYRYAGWEIRQYSDKVYPYQSLQYGGPPANHQALLNHIMKMTMTNRVDDIVIFTDEDTDRLPLAITDAVDVFSIVDPDGYSSHLESKRPYATASKADFIRNALFGQPACDRWSRHTDIMRDRTTKHITKVPTSSRPKEATMNRPTVVTNVSLQSSNRSCTIADIRTLLVEVERVGGTDDSTVTFDQNYYRWDVALTVKANEVESEAALSDEEVAALVAEAKTATKTRKAEIKTFLGL